jgi:hypothetical protein
MFFISQTFRENFNNKSVMLFQMKQQFTNFKMSSQMKQQFTNVKMLSQMKQQFTNFKVERIVVKGNDDKRVEVFLHVNRISFKSKTEVVRIANETETKS